MNGIIRKDASQMTAFDRATVKRATQIGKYAIQERRSGEVWTINTLNGWKLANEASPGAYKRACDNVRMVLNAGKPQA